jgi:transcriptional regulator CtsR
VISSTQINLAWTDASTNETGFKIERRIGADGIWTQIFKTGANVVSYANTGLTASTQYYYRIRAFNAVGNSAYSNLINATTSGTTSLTTPTAPSNLKATAISDSQINLTWTDNSANETGFKLESKRGDYGSWIEILVGANATSYQNTGLLSSSKYYYRIRAYNNSGNSAYSNETSAVTNPW